ncbi:hypothetical protein [Streptomyces sp. NRRL S-646]|uniref:hypothetical protein n=1 Tax=Streptomyces sp. NRRL S-646 TaxID=1463917 RepID=UPI0004C6ACE3
MNGFEVVELPCRLVPFGLTVTAPPLRSRPLVRDAGFTEIAPGLTVAVEGRERVAALAERAHRPTA